MRVCTKCRRTKRESEFRVYRGKKNVECNYCRNTNLRSLGDYKRRRFAVTPGAWRISWPETAIERKAEAVFLGVVVRSFGGKCAFCARRSDWKDFCRAHLDPRPSLWLAMSNVVPACASCNASMGQENWFTWYVRHAAFDPGRFVAIATHAARVDLPDFALKEVA